MGGLLKWAIREGNKCAEEHVQDVDTNSSSPHPPKVRGPDKPATQNIETGKKNKDTSKEIGS